MFSIWRGKQDKIVLELLSTEKSYVDDLKIVLSGYKQKVIYIRAKIVSIIYRDIIPDGFLKNICQGSNNIWEYRWNWEIPLRNIASRTRKL